MEQHPIPQQISSYEFKLVGEMTLKQFLKAAGGVVLALLINSSKIVFFIKYPAMLLCGAGGIALAFGSFQDRPLETWIAAFIRSIYSPTIYVFKKKADKNWLGVGAGKDIAGSEDKEVEEAETEEEPRPKKDTEKVEEFMESLPVKPAEEKQERRETATEETEGKEGAKEDAGKTVEETGLEKDTPKEGVMEVKKEETARTEPVKLDIKTERLAATGDILFGEIPMPDIPDTPNIVVGMVTDKKGKIVEGAIVEVQDEAGNPSRVLKTNALGQFKSSAPLANGRYLIITEKEGLKFDRVNVDLAGEIIQPIKIISL